MKNLAISFSGGGARAVSFLGFMRGLEKHGIRPTHVSSYSGGSWLLAAFSGKISDEELLEEFEKIKFWKLLALNPIKNNGLLNYKKFEDTLRKFTRNVDIEDLLYPTSIAISDVTDPYDPKLIIKTKGNLAKYSAISSIIAPIFPLYEENGRLFADGGYSTGYNSEYLTKEGMDVIIGFDAGSFLQSRWIGIVDGVARITRSLMSMRERFELERYPMSLIVKGFKEEGGIAAFGRAKHLYQEGFEMAESMIDDVTKLLD
jgi:predicted acylesterase/phospholipase RssA